MANPEKLHADTYSHRKSSYASVTEPMAAEAEAARCLVHRPPRRVWARDGGLARIPDPRKPERMQHQRVVVLVFGVLLFLTQGTSRREGNRPLTEPKS